MKETPKKKDFDNQKHWKQPKVALLCLLLLRLIPLLTYMYTNYKTDSINRNKTHDRN